MTEKSSIATQHDGPEMSEHMERHLNILSDAPIEGSDALVGELLRLWEDPQGFENPDDDALIEMFEQNPTLYVLHLGLVFGIEYEQAYPKDRHDEWPVPLEVR